MVLSDEKSGFPMRPLTNLVTALESNKTFGENFSIMLRWKRSVYKLLWKHMLIYFLVYILLSIIDQFILHENGKRNFRAMAEHCSRYSGSINLMVMLGFFTSTAMQRLFSMQTTVPGTAKSITIFISSLKPDLLEGAMIIEQFARWQLLAWVLTFRLVCRPLRKIYPDLKSLEATGLLTPEERGIMEDPDQTKQSTPCVLVVFDWMLLLLKETFIQKRYFNESNYLKNVDTLMAFKKSCGNVIKFATQNISPALVQAVVLSVYCFGCITVMARMFSKEDAPISSAFISYVPVLPAMQFFIYFAWLCFGKAALDPFGDDEDDIDVPQMVKLHIENAERLKGLYGMHLEKVFPNLVSPSKWFSVFI
uniref:Bestrophin homolog n=1 Tax=Daphnia magna TaxID=35525 RepID=A0A0P6FE31_9CRUS